MEERDAANTQHGSFAPVHIQFLFQLMGSLGCAYEIPHLSRSFRLAEEGRRIACHYLHRLSVSPSEREATPLSIPLLPIVRFSVTLDSRGSCVCF